MKVPHLRVQGHSRSLMLTFLRNLLPVLVTISSMSVLICNCFMLEQPIDAKIMFSSGRGPSFHPLFKGQRHEILS